MTSVRPALKRQAGSGDPVLSRNNQSAVRGRSYPRDSDSGRDAATSSTPSYLPASRTNPPSKIPQTSSAPRRPARPSPSPAPSGRSRPPLTHQSQSWSVAGSSTMPSRPDPRSAATFPAPSLQRPQAALADPRLRWKPSGLPSPAGPSSLPASLDLDLGLIESPTDNRLARKAEAPSAHTVTIYPELDRYRHVQHPPALTESRGTLHSDSLLRLATEDLPPPTPHFSGSGNGSFGSAFSASPSTRFSESPGPGPYSRDTTPTSISSYSPSIVSSARYPSGHTPRPGSRVRAGSFGKDAFNDVGGAAATSHTLAAIRESLNSSSSSSNGTVRAGGVKENKVKKKRLSPLPPSPPPRKSSQKFKGSTETAESPAKSPRPSQSSRPSRSPHPPRPPQLPQSSRPLLSRPIPVSEASQTAAQKAPTLSTATFSSRSQDILPTARPTPPARPSRDGTPDLQAQFGQHMPVIQSNLTATSLHDRNLSLGTASALSSRSTSPPPQPLQGHSQPAPPVLSSSSLSSSSPSRSRLPAPTTTVIAPASASVSASASASNISTLASTTGHASRSESRQDPGRSTRTPSPNVSTFRTRFPLFGRRPKPQPAAESIPTAPEKKDKPPPRKGPAAGTGHEGYGRLGAGRRRSSSSSSLARGVSAPHESPQFQDPFLRDRMSPVIIAGGEVIENRNTSSDMSRTDGRPRPSIDSRSGSQVSLSSHEGGEAHEERNTLWPSALPRDTRQALPLRSRDRRPSDSSDSEAPVMRSTLAFRRSVQRLHSPDQSQLRLPRPIIVRLPKSITSPSVNSLDTTILSDDSFLDPRPDPGRGRKNSTLRTVAPKKLTKRARSPRKWNLFGRSQSQPATINKGLESSSTVAVTIEAAAQSRDSKPVAFYTMIDSSEQEDGDIFDVEDALREAQVLKRPQSPQLAPGNQGAYIPAILADPLPAPPVTLLPPLPLSRQMPQPPCPAQSLVPPQTSVLGNREKQKEQAEPPLARTGRPSRLPQVGRIPKVVSARPEQTSPKSFSRPFNRVSLQPRSFPILDAGADSIARGSLQPDPATPELLQDGSTITSSSVDATTKQQRLSYNPIPETDHRSRPLLDDFLVFVPRNNSQATSCTTSSSSGLLSFADATAVVPDPNAPLVEDEIWDEYNDLLGEDPPKVSPSANSSQGMPFHLEGVLAAARNPAVRKALEKQPFGDVESPTIAAHKSARPPVPSSVYSTDLSVDVRETGASKQLPSTPFSVTEFVRGYGDRNNSVDNEKRPPKSQRSSTSSRRSARHMSQYSDVSVYSQVSEDVSPLSQVNLRVGSMTVSKWLTFGHVLFSPARDGMVPAVSPPNGHSVLVIDGLGNDDWSFYAAETYPAATFFNLSPRAPLPAGHGENNTLPLSPPNHHQVQYTSHGSKFPFQSEIFTTVVYRFPMAAPESHYRNVISEARRVLKPGGYIELSILDLDLNNMGTHTRRAVRRLKEQIHSHAPDVHLGSISDAILRLLAAKGYTDIKSCRVGLPVASAIPRSIGDTNEPGRQARDKKKKDDRSLMEMISDKNATADESITDMVAKVGRWWHGQCYGDTAAAFASDNTKGTAQYNRLWSDRSMLAECEEWGTSLKLMVCYARVPDVRRMVNV